MADISAVATTAILSAPVVAAAVTYLLTSIQKERDYKNEYYKKVIENRFAAYKLVDDLLATLSPCVKNEDGTDGDYLVVFWGTLYYGINSRNLDLDSQFNIKENYHGGIKQGDRQDEKYAFDVFSKNLAAALRQEIWLSYILTIELERLFDLFVKIAFEYDKLYSARVKKFKSELSLSVKIPEYLGERIPDYLDEEIPSGFGMEILSKLGREYHKEVIRLRERIKTEFEKDILSLHEVNEFIEARKVIRALADAHSTYVQRNKVG